jgi:hypothetical protein
MLAGNIITDAYERLNRLSPGETLSADDSAFGLRRLNLLVDEMSANRPFLYQDVLTSVVQSGNITLATGSWAALGLGSEIISMTSNNVPMSKLTMQQYNQLYSPTTTGNPGYWAFDGALTVYLFPVATGQTIKVQTRTGVTAFADLTTAYTAPTGYEAALGAALASRIAPTLLGRLPPEIAKAEQVAMAGIGTYDPAIIDVQSFKRPVLQTGGVFGGWF